MFLAKVNVKLRPSILDPQGKAVHHALQSLGLGNVHEVRLGKMIEVKIDCADQKEAERIAETACKKLLANPIMENYSFIIEKIENS